MCVIIYKPTDKVLSEDVVKESWKRNRDGAGFTARLGNNEWEMHKGIMLVDELLAKVHPYLGLGAELVLHLRVTTKGGTKPELTHPFEFTYTRNPKSRRYLFHNGTIKFLSPSLGVSDSSMFASILSKVKSMDAIRTILTKINKNSVSDQGLGLWNRFVTVTNEGVELWGDNESVYKDGIWFSNTRHENFVEKTNFYPTGRNMGYYDNARFWKEQDEKKKEREKPLALPPPMTATNTSSTPDFYNTPKILSTDLRNMYLHRIAKHYIVAMRDDQNNVDCPPTEEVLELIKANKLYLIPDYELGQLNRLAVDYGHRESFLQLLLTLLS